jgi:MYXO-CTERM domain-containing protein
MIMRRSLEQDMYHQDIKEGVGAIAAAGPARRSAPAPMFSRHDTPELRLPRVARAYGVSQAAPGVRIVRMGERRPAVLMSGVKPGRPPLGAINLGRPTVPSTEDRTTRPPDDSYGGGGGGGALSPRPRPVFRGRSTPMPSRPAPARPLKPITPIFIPTQVTPAPGQPAQPGKPSTSAGATPVFVPVLSSPAPMPVQPQPGKPAGGGGGGGSGGGGGGFARALSPELYPDLYAPEPAPAAAPSKSMLPWLLGAGAVGLILVLRRKRR